MKDGDTIRRVAVIGAGTIGASWTALFLAAGLDVAVHDPAEGADAALADYLETAWPSLQALGLAQGDLPPTPAVLATPEATVAGADFVQESVPERLPLKHELFRRIEPHLKPGAIVASSASGLLLREMQQAWADPSRLILAHPFNPPHLIPLVELLANEATADGLLDRSARFSEDCGKVTIRLRKEVPGHVANRLQAALWREAIHLVMEGVASVADVDKAITAGPGLRWSVMGPHMLFALASGGQGMAGFCERYGESFHRWWATLGTPDLTPEVGAALTRGIEAEAAGRDFATLAAQRDAKIVATLKALQAAEANGQ